MRCSTRDVTPAMVLPPWRSRSIDKMLDQPGCGQRDPQRDGCQEHADEVDDGGGQALRAYAVATRQIGRERWDKGGGERPSGR